MNTLVIFALAMMAASASANESNIHVVQAEHAVGFKPTNVHWRSNGGALKSVWLERDGDSLEFAICVPKPGTVKVSRLRFSQDGWQKEGAVLIDGFETGTFHTLDNSNHGYNWNEFHQTYGP